MTTPNELPEINSTVYYSTNAQPRHPREANFRDHALPETWLDGDELRVLAYADMSTDQTERLVPVVQHVASKKVSTVLPRLIRHKSPRDLWVEKAKAAINHEASQYIIGKMYDALRNGELEVPE